METKLTDSSFLLETSISQLIILPYYLSWEKKNEYRVSILNKHFIFLKVYFHIGSYYLGVDWVIETRLMSGVAVHTWIRSTQAAEEGRLWVWGHLAYTVNSRPVWIT